MGDDPIPPKLNGEGCVGKFTKVHRAHPLALSAMPLRQSSVKRALACTQLRYKRDTRDEVVLEIIRDLLPLRVGREIIASATLPAGQS